MASFIVQQNYIVLGAHLLSLWCSNQCLHTDHGRYLHCQHILLFIANQVTNHCWIKNKQSLTWCHMVLDHQVNKTKHVSIWKRFFAGGVKGWQDFHRLKGVYVVWGSVMNHLYLFVMQDKIDIWSAHIIVYRPEINVTFKSNSAVWNSTHRIKCPRIFEPFSHWGNIDVLLRLWSKHFRMSLME